MELVHFELEELKTNLGGKERISRLSACFGFLKAAGATLHIVSKGRKAVIQQHLQTAELINFIDTIYDYQVCNDALPSPMPMPMPMQL